MWKLWIKISLLFVLFLIWPAGTQAEFSHPVPEKKPAVERAPAFGFAYEQYDLSDNLSKADIKRYREIFFLQENADFNTANQLIEELDDTRLLGHVLHQRYMHKDYVSSYDELKLWLTHYADHPDAGNIYRLARRKAINAQERSDLPTPEDSQKLAILREPTIDWGKSYRSENRRSKSERQSIYAFEKELYRHIGKNYLSHALERLSKDPRAALMDTAEKDIIRSQIAVNFYYLGEIPKAFALARKTLKRSGDVVPRSAWVAGLVSWRHDQYKRAALYFEQVGSSPYASGWMAAAGSFWAARSHMKAGNFKQVSRWFEKAYEHPRTFYGLLATRALGKDFDFNWNMPEFDPDYDTLLTKIPAGARAKALIAVGRIDAAEEELLHINLDDDPQLAEVLLSFAAHAGLPKLSVRLASYMKSGRDGFYDAALYPEGPWSPKEGFRLDPSLIYAIMKQESHFNPQAKSPRGALGLMQIIPSTAAHIGMKDRSKLLDPAVNLDVAQRYIEVLLRDRAVDGDMLRMIVAYNAGPGNLAKWLKDLEDIEDPLMFIESIPLPETRAYVERVLSNYWIYQRRAGLETPSLTELAQGKWVSYAKMQEIQPFDTAGN